MQLTYRGQTYSSTQVTTPSTTPSTIKSATCVLRYRGVAYTH